MLNAILVANEFINMLPANETPSHTEGYEGYFHLLKFNREVELTTMRFYVIAYDRNKFNFSKEKINKITEYLNYIYGESVVYLNMYKYYNMGEKIMSNFEIVEALIKSMEKNNVKHNIYPTRGGTDGSILSVNAFPSMV